MARTVDVATNLNGPNVNVALAQPVDRSGAIRGQMEGQASSALAHSMSTQAQGIATDAHANNILSAIIPQATQAGLEIHKGMTLSDLQQQHNSEIDMFIARKNAGNTAIEMDTSQSLFNRMRDEFGEGAAIQQSSGAMQRFEEKSSMLKKALDQGAVSVDELETRLFALTRQAINKNPGLQNELINHAEKILHLSGVRSLRETNQKIDDAEQKFFEETRKNLTLDARKYGIPTDAFRMNEPDYLRFINEQVNDKKMAEAVWNEAKEAQKNNVFLNEEQSKQWIRTNGVKHTQGGLFELYTFAQQAMAEAGENHQKAIDKIDTAATFMKRSVEEQFSMNGALASPEGKDALDRFNANIDAVNARAARSTTMADLKTGLDNIHSMMSDREGIELRKVMNLTAHQILSQYPDEVAKWRLRDPTVQARMTKSFDELLNQSFGSATIDFFTSYGKLEAGKSDAVALLEKPAKLGDMEVFKLMIEGYSKVEKSIDNDRAKMDFFTDLSRTFSRSDYLKFFKEHPDGNLASQVFGMVDRAITNMGSAVKRDSRGGHTASVMPGGDGIIFSIPENRSKENELNSKYAKQFNDFIKVYAAMNGVTTKQAFEYVAPRYQNTFNIQGLKEVSENIQQKIIGTESGGNANAKNPNSSATGSAQFVNQTWLDVMNKHFGELTEGKSNEQILAMRKNPNLNKLAEQMFRKENQQQLESAGIPVNDANIYLAHFLGAGTAKKLIQSNPSTPIEQLLSSQVISANKSILQGKTASQVINWANDKMNKSFKA